MAQSKKRGIGTRQEDAASNTRKNEMKVESIAMVLKLEKKRDDTGHTSR